MASTDFASVGAAVSAASEGLEVAAAASVIAFAAASRRSRLRSAHAERAPGPPARRDIVWAPTPPGANI